MGEPSTTNGAATVANSLIHLAIFNVAVTVAETALFAEFPFLNLPVVKQIIQFIINWVAGKVYGALGLMLTYGIIDIQVAGQEAVMGQATINLKAAYQSGDPDATKKATDEFKAALAALIHWNGSASR